MSTRRKKFVCISSGVLSICVIAATVATFLVLRETRDDDATTTPSPVPFPVTVAPSPGPAPPLVKMTADGGSLRGEWVTVSEVGFTYAAFRGVPYAQPPVGPLRFKAPLPVVSWSDVRDAITEGSECMQQDQNTGKMVGSEDCLYLNVYTPLRKEAKLPVYLFIHGGTFMFGSGSRATYGPDFFMLKNMIVVTINYRLNAFGFLNLDNDVVPGNAGIKDQIAALKWVHDNIAKFGGDPDLITIGGQSAGAVSAHWLTLLPSSRGLVKRVILESGSAVHSFAYNEDNFDVATELATRLTNATVHSRDEMGRLFMELPGLQILTAAVAIAAERLNTVATQIPFATSPERRSPTAGGQTPLITQDPELYVLQDDNPVPMFVGMNSREWLFSFYYYGYAANPEYMRSRIANLITVFPKTVVPHSETASYLQLTNTLTIQQAVAKAHAEFFEHYAPNCDDTCVFKKYLDDIVIGVDTNRLAELRARNGKSTTFVYRFGVRAKYSTSPLADPGQEAGGAVHSDELGYLWKMDMLQQQLSGDDLASKTLRRMVNMWSSFVRSGTPNPGEAFTGSWRQNEERSTPGNVIFMNISETLDIREEEIAGPDTPFWLGLFQEYRENRST